VSQFCYVTLTELGTLRPLVNSPSPISVREHCEDSPDHSLAIPQGVHRDLAHAITIVDANLADMAVAIASRYANFYDRGPAHLAMVAKRESCLIELEWPVQAVQPQRCAALRCPVRALTGTTRTSRFDIEVRALLSSRPFRIR
jgi:hypothetical protein